MGAELLSGKVVSDSILKDLSAKIDQLSVPGKKPCLAVILVGEDPASQVYVSRKQKVCEQIGIETQDYRLSSTIHESELIALIQRLNLDPSVNGILLQVPLPKGLDDQKMLHLIDPEKDVDGFHPVNIGKTLLGLEAFRSCTPQGVCELLNYYDISTQSKHVVIVGRSNIVGKPLASLLIQKGKQADATVTICHSRTKDLAFHTKQADILVAAIGRANFITKEMVKPGAIVIDVGVNRVDDSSKSKGFYLAGDVDTQAVSEVASRITPVPGGVGPMTIAVLMKNTVLAFSRQHQLIAHS